MLVVTCALIGSAVAAATLVESARTSLGLSRKRAELLTPIGPVPVGNPFRAKTATWLRTEGLSPDARLDRVWFGSGHDLKIKALKAAQPALRRAA